MEVTGANSHKSAEDVTKLFLDWKTHMEKALTLSSFVSRP
jgi:hypothetical protein